MLLLDEPIAGVHPALVTHILSRIRDLGQAGKLVVFIEHDLAAVRCTAETAVFLDNGRGAGPGGAGTDSAARGHLGGVRWLTEQMPILRLEKITAGYGKKQVLTEVQLAISPRAVVAVIGHNGAGKSTLLKAAFGIIPLWSGALWLDGVRMATPTPRALLQRGMAYVPQGNRVFTDLTVLENIQLGATMLPSGRVRRERIDSSLAHFPELRARVKQRAGTLSGGEKQMLALLNALMLEPRVLLLDEPSLGLGPESGCDGA